MTEWHKCRNLRIRFSLFRIYPIYLSASRSVIFFIIHEMLRHHSSIVVPILPALHNSTSQSMSRVSHRRTSYHREISS